MVSFSQTVFEDFLADNDESAIVMLNLLEFVPNVGRERYFTYLKMVRPILSRFGAEILIGGDGLSVLTTGPAKNWDAVLLVRYPNRAAFKAMVQDPDYQTAFKVGQSAIADIVLQPLKPNPQML